MKSEANRTSISISRKTHECLSTIGKKGDSFDDIIQQLLSKVKGMEVNK